MKPTTVKVFVGNLSNGTEHFETLLAEDLRDGSYRLHRTPKMALGLAREDVFRVDDLGNVRDVRPGGYYAFQLVMADAFTEQSLSELIELVLTYGGTLDVHDDIVAGLAFPQAGDVEVFLAALVEFLKRHGGQYWNASKATPEIRSRG